MVKRKVDPDRTLLSYLQEPINVENEYVLDSDYSSEDEEEKNLGGIFSDLDEEDFELLENEELNSEEEDDINEEDSSTN